MEREFPKRYIFKIILYDDVYIFNLVSFIKIRDYFKSKWNQV